MSDHPRLKGLAPTIGRESFNSDDVFETATLNRLKRDFEEDDVESSETLFDNLLYRNGTERQKLLSHFDLVDILSNEESDPELMKDILWCLGDFPKYEKKFLARLLSSTASSEDKFRFLEEVIFSKSPEFLERFIEAETKLNNSISENLAASPVGNENITKAVEAVFKGEDPFPLPADMYEIADGGRSLKTTYNFCREKAPRLVFLKNLLLEGNSQSNIPLVTKIILSHCYIDLQSILNRISLTDEESTRMSEFKFGNSPEYPPDLSRVKELSSLQKIKGDFLRELVQKAVFPEQ